ncbi:MAG: XcyI family restriction endonuclease [Chloroflexota bacterium]|nr:MAG: XcyI family restriction endonuclease [Chloroflexota bacterium]
MIDALSEALASADPKEVKRQLNEYVPKDAQRILAAAGVRDEYVFPVPAILEAKPSLVGYYRLLLGTPKKTFYGTGSVMKQFASMEERYVARPSQVKALPIFCETISAGLADLVRQMRPAVTDRDVRELPLLTFGPQLQGGRNNIIGQLATEAVFATIAEIVAGNTVTSEAKRLTIKNESGRAVIIALGADPDVRIQEKFDDGSTLNNVAIEIKGGTDASNAQNRAGEAEKSHAKARTKGFRDFWTVISIEVGLAKLQDASRSTRVWFDAAQVIGRSGEDWERFRQQIASAVGVRLS